jgi:hypothetical protein
MSQLQRINNLTFYCQYILSLLLFVIKNNDIFPTKNEIHSTSTRNSNNSNPPLLHLTKAQKVVYFSGIKTYNSFSKSIKELSYGAKKFKVTLKNFLVHSFYSLEE